MTTETKKPDDFSDLIPRFMELFEIVHARCPLDEKYAHLTLGVSGYEQRNCRIDAFYSATIGVIAADGVPELLSKIQNLDPEKAKRERIAKLKEELLRLEQPDSEAA